MKFKLMVYILVVMSLLLLTIPCFATDSVTINLKMLPMSIQDNNFYITQVVDGKIDKSNIGTVQKAPAYLSNDFTTSILSYLNNCFVVADNKTPILIIIDKLNISESGDAEVLTRAEGKIEFYKVLDGKVGKLFETEELVERIGSLDNIDIHEENIRNVIEKCFVSFINSNWNKVEVVWQDQSKINEMIANKEKQRLTKIVAKKAFLGKDFYYMDIRLSYAQLSGLLKNVTQTKPELDKAENFYVIGYLSSIAGAYSTDILIGELIGGVKKPHWSLLIGTTIGIYAQIHLGLLANIHYEKAVEIYNANILAQ